jgi:hypothetical protein
VDRLSGYLVGGKASRAEVNEATKKVFAGEVVLTVTLDRGKEFLDAEGAAAGAGSSRILLPSPPSLREGPTKTPTGFSGTGFRKAKASTMSTTGRCRRCTIHSTKDRASA